MQDKINYFSKNLILFAISGLGSKIITFLLVPVYTNYLSTEEYGLIDLVGTITNITLPVFTVGLESSVSRFLIDGKFDQKEVLSISSYIWKRSLVFNAFFVLIGMIVYSNSGYPFFWVFYLLCYVFQGIKDILNAIYRGVEDTSVLMEASILNSATFCIFNILFIVCMRTGISGYFISYALSSAITVFFGYIRSKIRSISFNHTISGRLKKEIEKFGIPMIFNQLGWWMNNSLDKYIVIFFLGMSQNGIYSMAYRIPSILSILSSIFANAWGMSAIKEYSNNDRESFYSKMYSEYNSICIILCSILLILNYPFAKILFAKNFFEAWHISGILLVAFVFNSMSGFLGAFFSASMDTVSYAVSTIAGGVINIISSIILVHYSGIYGVAIGTLISFISIWMIRLYIATKKYVKLDINYWKQIIMYMVLMAECIVGLKLFAKSIILIQLIMIGILLLFNLSELTCIFRWIFVFVTRKLRMGGKDGQGE